MVNLVIVPPHLIWLVVACHAAAITCTATRLVYRWHTKRFWWEDVWAVIAAMWTVVCLTGFLLHNTSMSPMSARNQVSDWLGTLSNTMVVWAVRCSIFLSLVRVSNPTGSSRYIALACIASFLIMCVATTAQKIYYCGAYHCDVSSPVAILQLTTDVSADAVLVLAPIPFLRDVHLSQNRRILILTTFSSSLFVSAISITQSAFLFRAYGLITVVLAEFKVSTSLFVCNLLVLVTCVYRVWRRGKGDGVDLDASCPCRQTFYLTPIDPAQFTAGTFSSSSSGGGGTGTQSRYTPTDAGSTSRHGTVQEEDACTDREVSDAVDVERLRAPPEQGALGAPLRVFTPQGPW